MLQIGAGRGGPIRPLLEGSETAWVRAWEGPLEQLNKYPLTWVFALRSGPLPSPIAASGRSAVAEDPIGPSSTP